MFTTPIHSLRVSEVLQALETSAGGLASAEAASRRSLYGSNELLDAPTAPLWRKGLAHTTHPMALLLWAAGGVAALGGDILLGLVMWSVVMINAGFSFWREHQAGRATAALQHLLPHYARVLRDGVETRLPSSELVTGDLLILAEGDHVPADARVIEAYGLRVDNSALTGESVPAHKTSDASLSEGISEVERPNLIFAGTSVLSGTGRALVFATGMLTQFGRIARLTQAVPESPSRLQKELLHLTRSISFVACGAGVIVFITAMLDVGLPPGEAFLLGIGIIVAAVPEGLPATITLALAAAVQRLAKKGVLVKKLSMVETLGTVSVICTDKSGTLTQNQMTVRQVWAGGQNFSVSGVGYEPSGRFSPNPESTNQAGDLAGVLLAGMLCNNSRLTPPTAEQPRWSCLGDQTEAALHVAARKFQLDEAAIAQALPRFHELPFDARRKRMSTLHRVNGALAKFPDLEPGAQVAFVKGAPREVLQLCTHIRIQGEDRPLDEALRSAVLAANDEYARGALRVLALARGSLPRRAGGFVTELVERNLTFLGLTAMMDPPRTEVTQAVAVFRQAGIRMVMITGDYGLTAESLARRVGMLSSLVPLIITGADVEQMSDAELSGMLERESIFARMAPEHKLRVVAALQARGEVVAVTGDGVNDAPALRKADIGVAMGITGTDVAREAADIILTDDNFAAIAAAVQEGRAVYENLRKFITYIFSSNVPEILPFFFASIFKLPLALGVKQVLAIDLGTDIFPALALGVEPPEPDIMQHPPRNPNRPLVDRGLMVRSFLFLGLIEALLCYAGYFFVYDWVHNPIFSQTPWFRELAAQIMSQDRTALAVTVSYAGVVMAQVGNAFACRTDRNHGRSLGWASNPVLLLGIGIEILVLLALVYLAPLAGLFGHVALPGLLWPVLLAYPLVIYSLDWLGKGWLRLQARKMEEHL